MAKKMFCKEYVKTRKWRRMWFFIVLEKRNARWNVKNITKFTWRRTPQSAKNPCKLITEIPMKAKKKHKRWWIIALSVVMGLVLLYGVGGLIASAAVCHAIFGKRASSLSDLDHFPSFYAKRADIASLEKREDISFVSGENTLTGHLYRTDTPKGLVLAANGMSSQSDGEDAEYQAWFLEEGYDV